MRSLKAFLAFLIAGTAVPGLLFGVGTSWWLATEMRVSAEHEAQIIAEQSAANVAEHVRLVTAAMNTLARSPALGQQNLAEAHRFATLLAQDLGQHIGLASADGQQLFNTRRPFGTQLPRRADSVSYTRALTTGQPSVSNIIIGALTKRPLITIDVPVSPERVLGTSTDLDAIGTILERTKLKPGWKAAVVDGDGRFIARSFNPAEFVGKPAVPGVVAVAKESRRNGSFRHRTHEGEEVVSFFSKVAGTDWMVVVGTPEPVLFAPLHGSLAVLAVAGGGAIALTMAAAVVLGRRLNTAAGRLTEDAHAMANAQPMPALSQTIKEFEEVEAVLHEADRLRRDREEQLTLARHAAEQSVAAKNRFFAAASHDLKQPLQASIMSTEILRQIGDPKGLRYLDILEQAHVSLANLVSNLFEIAEMDANGVTPKVAPVNLTDLTRRIVTECRPAADGKGLDLRARTRCDFEVSTDGGMLTRVIRNLVHNAIRYTEAGGVLLTCRRRGDSIWIEIWDTGIGIPEDKLPLIWEEFYQIGDRGNKGSGLGLAIVCRMARLLGYRIKVQSRPGRGSMFRVMVPLAPPGIEATPAAAAVPA